MFGTLPPPHCLYLVLNNRRDKPFLLTSFEIKMMMKIYASQQVTLKGLVGFENNFNGIYFHPYFYLKTGVSRNGLSLGYSEQETSTVCSYSEILLQFPQPNLLYYLLLSKLFSLCFRFGHFFGGQQEQSSFGRRVLVRKWW